MPGKAKLLTYCGVTCLGGAERRLCKCECPDDCEMTQHPDFELYRQKSDERFDRLLQNAVHGYVPAMY